MGERLALLLLVISVTASHARAQDAEVVPPAPFTQVGPAGAPPAIATPVPEAPPPPAAGDLPPAPAGTEPSAAAEPAPAADSGAADSSDLGAPTGTLNQILSELRVHGFVSEGGFVSTANEFIGSSTRGSLKLFEAGINISVEPVDRLRVGLQLVHRSVGVLSEDVPRIDWAILDYRFLSWLGMRAGIIRIPLGLYNEYVDIDSARTAILMPQSTYPLRNRDVLISHTGVGLYGNVPLGPVGALDYQVWGGTLSIPRSALELKGGTLLAVDTRYAAGAQLFWRPPLEGLRVGISYMRAWVDFKLRLDSDVVAALVMAKLLPTGHDGSLGVSQKPAAVWMGSVEYVIGDFLFAAEYARWLKHQTSSLPMVLPTLDEDVERFYALANYRISTLFELGVYYAVTHLDVHHRTGRDVKPDDRIRRFQRDLTASLRIDVNEYWLWKLEAHLIDGIGELQQSLNPNPERHWGLFLIKTTVTF